MKILLLNPPIDYYVPMEYRTEGLGIGYIASVLRRDGHEVEILDAHLQCLDLNQVFKEVISREFDCLGVTASSAHKKSLLWLAKKVRAKRKDTIIIAGGYLPSLTAEYLLKECPELDFIVRGEGEQVASDVFTKIFKGENWQDAPGIGFMKGDTPVLNPLPQVIQDLDTIPFPARDVLSQSVVPLTSVGIASSRGCYHRCSFCCLNGFYELAGSKAPRFRRPERVVDEIESVLSSTNIRSFRFVDDDFIGPGGKTHERVYAIADEIENRKLDITFSIECRADVVNLDILKRLKAVGLTDVFLGIESGVQRQLDTFNKRITVQQNKDAIQIVRDSGIELRTGFIMFDPYTTVDEINENMQFIKEFDLDKEARKVSAPFVSKLVLHRGTPLVEQLRKDGLLIEKGIDVDYKFKDPQVQLMSKVAMASSIASGCMRTIKKAVGIGKKSAG